MNGGSMFWQINQSSHTVAGGSLQIADTYPWKCYNAPMAKQYGFARSVWKSNVAFRHSRVCSHIA